MGIIFENPVYNKNFFTEDNIINKKDMVKHVEASNTVSTTVDNTSGNVADNIASTTVDNTTGNTVNGNNVGNTVSSTASSAISNPVNNSNSNEEKVYMASSAKTNHIVDNGHPIDENINRKEEGFDFLYVVYGVAGIFVVIICIHFIKKIINEKKKNKVSNISSKDDNSSITRILSKKRESRESDDSLSEMFHQMEKTTENETNNYDSLASTIAIDNTTTTSKPKPALNLSRLIIEREDSLEQKGDMSFDSIASPSSVQNFHIQPSHSVTFSPLSSRPSTRIKDFFKHSFSLNTESRNQTKKFVTSRSDYKYYMPPDLVMTIDEAKKIPGLEGDMPPPNTDVYYNEN